MYCGYATINAPKSRGVALITVLWLVVLLASIATSIAGRTNTEIVATRIGIDRLRAKARAEGAIWGSIYRLATSPARYIVGSSTPPSQRDSLEPLSVSVQHTGGLVDLNSAPVDLLRGVVANANIAEVDAQAIAAAILDWRDADHNTHVGGAEDHDYQMARVGYECKDAPFNSVEELRQVLGVNQWLYAAIAPVLTVYNPSGGVNVFHAPDRVLNMLPGLSEKMIDDIKAARGQHDVSHILARLPAVYRADSATGQHSTTVIIAANTTVGQIHYRIEATVWVNPHAKTPYQIIAWRSGSIAPPTTS